MTYIADIVI